MMSREAVDLANLCFSNHHLVYICASVIERFQWRKPVAKKGKSHSVHRLINLSNLTLRHFRIEPLQDGV
jgi:hypothetical protein